MDPCLPLKESDLATSNPLLHSITSLFLLHFAHRSLSFCTVPHSSFLSAKWNDAWFMNSCTKPIRSLEFPRLNFFFFNTRCWEQLKAGGEGDDRGWDGWMASSTRWMWVWASSRSCWWTGKPGVLQSTESQRVGHDWATELILILIGQNELGTTWRGNLHRNFLQSLHPLPQRAQKVREEWEQTGKWPTTI